MRISDWSSDVCSSDLAGEIFLNSVDHDGARKGYDLDSLRAVATAVDLPVIAFGGVFTWPHLLAGIEAGAEAVAAANIFHYTEQATRKAKTFLRSAEHTSELQSLMRISYAVFCLKKNTKEQAE